MTVRVTSHSTMRVSTKVLTVHRTRDAVCVRVSSVPNALIQPTVPWGRRKDVLTGRCIIVKNAVRERDVLTVLISHVQITIAKMEASETVRMVPVRWAEDIGRAVITGRAVTDVRIITLVVTKTLMAVVRAVIVRWVAAVIVVRSKEADMEITASAVRDRSSAVRRVTIPMRNTA